VSQPSAEELEKIYYLEKVGALKEKKYAENLTFILEYGFSNFEVNLSLLKRNNNDLPNWPSELARIAIIGRPGAC
jgi:hypothetical protein